MVPTLIWGLSRSNLAFANVLAPYSLNALRPLKLRQGRANYTMQFEKYEPVPDNIAQEIVEHQAGEPVGAAS